MSDIKFTEGIYFNKPHEKLPDFVKMKIKIERDKLLAWLKSQEAEIWIEVKEAKSTGKWYGSISDYVPKQKDEAAPEAAPQTTEEDDLPF